MFSRPRSCFTRQTNYGLGNRNKFILQRLQRLQIGDRKRGEVVIRALDNVKQQRGNNKSEENENIDSIEKLLQKGKEAQPMGQPKDSILVCNPFHDKSYQNNLFDANHSFFIIDPKRAYLNETITLVQSRFRNRHRLARLVSQILQRRIYSENGYLKEFPTYVVKALLQFHPSMEEKKLYDIVRIQTGAPPPPHPKEKRCFWVERSDGSREDVSYRKCITQQTTEHGTFIRAAQFQILSLQRDYKNSLFESGQPVYCEKTGALLSHAGECIVICANDPFEYIISQFVHRFRIDVASVQYIIQTNQQNKKKLLLSSAGLRMQLERYFRENVKFCVVHKWYFLKQLNQILLQCTETPMEVLYEMDNWEKFGSIRQLREPVRSYEDGDVTPKPPRRQRRYRKRQHQMNTELEKQKSEWLNQQQTQQNIHSESEQHESGFIQQNIFQKEQLYGAEITQNQQEYITEQDQSAIANLEQIWGINEQQQQQQKQQQSQLQQPSSQQQQQQQQDIEKS